MAQPEWWERKLLQLVVDDAITDREKEVEMVISKYIIYAAELVKQQTAELVALKAKLLQLEQRSQKENEYLAHTKAGLQRDGLQLSAEDDAATDLNALRSVQGAEAECTSSQDAPDLVKMHMIAQKLDRHAQWRIEARALLTARMQEQFIFHWPSAP